MRLATVAISIALLCIDVAHAGPFRVLLQGNDRLAILAKDGSTDWSMPWGAIHDVHVLANGHLMVQRGATEVVEIDPASKKVVWAYDAQVSNGNQDRPVEVHSFQPLADGGVMIAESGLGRIIEVDRQGRLTKELRLKIDKPQTHHDTRLARKLRSGNYLVCHEGDGAVREYDGRRGNVVWEYPVPLFGRQPREGHGPEAFGNQAFAAVRLKNGNTLIATGNGHSVLEVAPDKTVVWKLGQRDLPGIVLAWVTTLEVLPNGNYVVGNCHAGPGQPLLVEIEPKTKRVVWRFDRYDDFGNAVSNSELLDVAGQVVR
jgi:outer membrane protein assembly factor BamB